MGTHSLLYRIYMTAMAAFLIWLALGYQPPTRYRLTHGQRRVFAMGRPVIALAGIALLISALWP